MLAVIVVRWTIKIIHSSIIPFFQSLHITGAISGSINYINIKKKINISRWYDETDVWSVSPDLNKDSNQYYL